LANCLLDMPSSSLAITKKRRGFSFATFSKLVNIFL